MRNILNISIVSFLIILSGCGTTKTLVVRAQLERVSSEEGVQKNIVENKFNNGKVEIDAVLDNNRLVLNINNLSDKKMKIHWDKSTLVDPLNQSYNICFKSEGINNVNLNEEVNQTSTIVMPHTNIIGVVNKMISLKQPIQAAVNNYHSSTSSISNQIQDYNTYQSIITRNSNISIEDDAINYINKPIKLTLFTQLGNQTKKYNFNFKITHFIEK